MGKKLFIPTHPVADALYLFGLSDEGMMEAQNFARQSIEGRDHSEVDTEYN